MKQSEIFTKVLKDAPADEQAVNAQLLIRAGYIYKVMAGVYAFLPLGLRVLEKIKAIVRAEMDQIGGQELIMTSLQRQDLWEKTDRWDDEKVDVWFKSKLKNGTEVGFGWSHEEQMTEMMKNYIGSYRDLPIIVYQFQTKLRNELRAKSGILRGREFVMKDMYSYTTDESAHQLFYDQAIQAYHRVFERVGLGAETFLTFASGGAFTQFSHEFQTITEVGDDVVYLHRAKKIAINKEVLTDEVMKQLGVARSELEMVKTAEVGNIFSFGSAKSEILELRYKTATGETQPVILGSYGIGITRLMGVIVEKFHDEKGIIWPQAVAPFAIHLLNIAKDNRRAEEIYQTLLADKFEVLYDQRDLSPGNKFAESDALGIPVRILVSDKTLVQDSVEIKHRHQAETALVKIGDLSRELKK